LICGVFTLFLADQYSTSIGKPISVLLISHQDQIYNRIDMFFRNYPELMTRLRTKGDRLSMPLEGFEFIDNHSKVLMRMDTSRAIRGIHTNSVIMDEVQATPREIILQDAYPCATEIIEGTNPKFILVGTPSDSKSFFVDLLINTKKKKSKQHKAWSLSQYSSETCPWLNIKINGKSIIDGWKENMNPETYMTEVLAQVPGLDIISPFKNVKKNSVEDCTLDPMGLPGSYKILGLDLGYAIKTNRCGVVLLERYRKSVKSKVLVAQEYDPIPQDFIIIINDSKPSIVIVDSKPQPLADKIRNEL